ncbi:RNA processing protein [Scheffersomyces xylosifermentans]|uniref:RNA processing protein n=1 Tax=Scheffersomyces xylosifermentans TaxID=1304137 RepID=UPI00315D17F4
MTSNQGEVFCGGATTSQHVDAEDDDHFENTTFKLKRTRSMGLLDDFIGDGMTPSTSENKEHTDGISPVQQQDLQNQISPSTLSSSAMLPSSSSTSDSLSSSEDSENNIIRSTSTPNMGRGTNAIPSSTVSHSQQAVASPLHPLTALESGEASPTLSETLDLNSPELLPHDDTDIMTEPSQHVDYLSHKWDVSDISKSWRYVIQKRKDVADSARLENASWRTWAQRRCNLKTISPEALNWSKDSDVTWLYGPILKDDDSLYLSDHTPDSNNNSHKAVTASSAVAGDISIPNKDCPVTPKPILKRRTVQETMISHSNLLKLQLATNKMYQKQREKQIQIQKELQREQEHRANINKKTPEFDDYDAISAKLNSQYKTANNTSGSSSANSSVIKLQSLLKESRGQGSATNLKHQPQTPDFGPSNIDDDAEATNFKMFLSPRKDKAASADAVSTGNALTASLPIDPSAVNALSAVSGGLVANKAIGDTALDSPTAHVGTSNESILSNSAEQKKAQRHIHFNDEVQQCISIDVYNDEEDDEEDDGYYYDNDEDYEGEYEEDGYIYENVNNYGNSSDGTAAPGQPAGVYSSDADEEGDDDEDDDEEGGFFLKVKSPNTPATAGVPSLSSQANPHSKEPDHTEDSDSVSTINSSKVYRTIHLLPSTSLNYGSDEESDEENPYTSSLSHNVNNDVSRGYDYYYDYNTVYTVDPSHAIYGSNKKETPDVCDVPENITMGSNFDYDVIENEDAYSGMKVGNELPIINPAIISKSNINNVGSGNTNTGGYGYNVPSNTTTTNANAYTGGNNSKIIGNAPRASNASSIHESVASPFHVSDSEGSDDDDSDDGLSIATRTSSHSLAQSVFGPAMTSSSSASQKGSTTPRHFPEAFEAAEPTPAPVSDINPNHSSAAISKMPTSSSSLSQSFFSGGLTKQKSSSSALSASFFNTPVSHSDDKSPSVPSITSSNTESESVSSPAANPSNLAPSSPLITPTTTTFTRKASPLPPHTTSANAFSGSSTPPKTQSPQSSSYALQQQPAASASSTSVGSAAKNTFLFDDSESDSDSENEHHQQPSLVINKQRGNSSPSYASLSQVADKNGVRSPSPDGHLNEEDGTAKNIVDQAKDMFWNAGSSVRGKIQRKPQ